MTRLFLAVLAMATLAACDRTALPPETASRSVGYTTRSWADESRSDWSGAGPRPLAVEIWYPTDEREEKERFLGPPTAPLFSAGRAAIDAEPATEGRYPLVLLSHGTGGSAGMLAWLGEALARRGYVAVAINHHGNTSAESIKTPQGFMLPWERAIDLSRVLDELLEDPTFAPSIDPERVGVAGFSLGGYTAIAVAGGQTSLEQWQRFCATTLRDATCDPQPEYPDAFADFEKVRQQPAVQGSLARHGASYLDSRIKAVYAIAPVGSWLTDESLARITVPVRIVVGDADRTAPEPANAGRVAGLIPRTELLVLPNVGHYTFLADCLPAGMTAFPDLCAEMSGVDRAAVHAQVARDATGFFDRAFGPR